MDFEIIVKLEKIVERENWVRKLSNKAEREGGWEKGDKKYSEKIQFERREKIDVKVKREDRVEK